VNSKELFYKNPMSYFGKGISLLALVFTLRALPAQISLTIDDPEFMETPRLRGAAGDQALRDHLKTARLQAALFVCGMRVDNAAGRSLLKAWDEDGHLIANHSYSHKNYNSTKVTTEFLTGDISKAEKLIANLKHFTKLFRFPFLKEGETDEKRDALRRYLSKNGYRQGAVTIDASDWYVDGRLMDYLEKNPQADTGRYRDFYLKHIWDRATYYNNLSKKVLGREVRHTLLIHHSLLNALYLGDLIAMFKERGWTWIDAGVAFQDPVFEKLPAIVPAGEGLIWGLAHEAGVPGLRYPAEDGEYEKAEMDRLGL
jgi:peptidoglycan-N-acetylglucosamine deacetylase